MGTGKNMVRKRDTRVSLARSVLSCAHYSQAPATQAVREFVQTSRLFIFGVCFILTHENTKSFSYQWLQTYPCFETEGWGNTFVIQ